MNLLNRAHGPRNRTRRRASIRTLLIVLTVIPSLTLLLLWGFTTQRLWKQSDNLNNQYKLSQRAGFPTLLVLGALQEERRLSAAWLTAPDDPRTLEALKTQRAQTDSVAARFETLARKGLPDSLGDVRRHANAIRSALSLLPETRSRIDARQGGQTDLLRFYDNGVNLHVTMFNAFTYLDDGPLVFLSQMPVNAFRADEMIAREDVLLMYSPRNGVMPAADYAEFLQVVGSRRTLYDQMLTFTPKDLREAFVAITRTPAWERMVAAENAMMTARPVVSAKEQGFTVPVRAAEWRAAMDEVNAALDRFANRTALRANGVNKDRADELELTARMVAVLGLLAVVVVAVLCWRITRSLRRRLLSLRSATVELGEQRLPVVVERLRRGESIEEARAAAGGAELPYGNDEIGQIAHAFKATERVALDSAEQLAHERQGYAKVFYNVALRTQSLISRQLSELDGMERRHQDPDVLKDLFTLDHLATRVRRYEENLVILSGHQPRRRWSKSVPVIDVVRSALGEIEDYERVTVTADADTALAGPSVGAVVHLLAELVENAISFSPPKTPVQIRASSAAKGVVIEIEDRGLGMSDTEFEVINANLANPAPFEVVALAKDVRIGLFVVAQLAAQHDITVTLRSSPYGGTLAIVFLSGERNVEPSPEQGDDEAGHREESVPEPSSARVEIDVAEPSRDAPATVIEAPPSPQRQTVTAMHARGDEERPSGRRPLPRRVPQAELPAPLRGEAPVPEPAKEPRESAPRSPESAAAMVSAFRTASERARAGHQAPHVVRTDAAPAPDGDPIDSTSAIEEPR